MTDETLKPCPFCGGGVVEKKDKCGVSWAECVNCEAEWGHCPAHLESRYSDWNTRSPEQDYWWCEACSDEVPNEAVTYEETHDPRNGGCGEPVVIRSNSEPAQEGATEPAAWVRYELASAENAESAIHKKLVELGWTPPQEPEAREPVAYGVFNSLGKFLAASQEKDCLNGAQTDQGLRVLPLYTAPPDDDEARRVEAKLLNSIADEIEGLEYGEELFDITENMKKKAAYLAQTDKQEGE